jgi:GNAT superfamily N-acetyltransferase
MEDLYLKYRKEREGIEYIAVEGAFIVFKDAGDYCYIEDVYCIPELRQSGISYELAKKVEEMAKKAGYKKMLGSVNITANNPEIGLKACFNNGYKILKLEGSIIWLHKEI